jgi:hypothetical protein
MTDRKGMERSGRVRGEERFEGMAGRRQAS